MKEELKVYVDRMRDGEVEELSETLAPTFMDIHENEMRFEDPITIQGQAYVTDDWLILNLAIQTKATLICSVCNDSFVFEINIQDMVHDEPLENLRDKTFDVLPLVRETALLAIPLYPQCGLTHCKRRHEIEPYLKSDKDKPEEESDEHTHKPFKDLL